MVIIQIIIVPVLYPGPNPPSFVGDHYYCESGNGNVAISTTHYTGNVLWDGLLCPSANNCCTNPNMPWFFWQIALPVSEYLEARICHRSPFSTAGTLVESIELYIQ